MEDDQAKKEQGVRDRLQLRNGLKKILLKPPGTVHKRGAYLHPYEKFAVGRVVIRSLDDTSYPEVDESPGI